MKSIKFNSVIYAVKTILGMVFPLITFKYVAGVLSVETLGKVRFSTSIISYFSLIAGLGIYTFAVKKGAGLREDKEEMNRFCSEIFTINLTTTIGSYLLFYILLIFNSKWSDYSIIMIIISSSILLTTLGVDWLYTIYEEYLYATIRTLLVQIISVVFLFLFVKNDTDIYLYASYTVMVGVGSNIFNIIRSRKFVKIRITFSKRMINYIVPILILFSTTIATQINLNADITIIGYLTSDKDVGLYNSSVKIFNIVKTVLLSIGTVSMPRLAYYIGKGEYNAHSKTFENILRTLLFIIIPCTLGLSIVSNEALLLFADKKYEGATLSLCIMSYALPFSIMGSFFSSGLLVPYSKEKIVLLGTAIAATTNIILNILLIPRFGFTVAAATTVISECIAAIIEISFSKKYLKDIKNLNLGKDFIAATIMVASCVFVKMNIHFSNTINFVLIVMAGVISFFISSLLLRNDILISFVNGIMKKIHRYR